MTKEEGNLKPLCFMLDFSSLHKGKPHMATVRERPAHFYENLNESLRQLIRRGKYQPGDQFLTERQVSEQFETSRPTANKALASLVSEGLLEFRKGVGTFVQAGVLDYDLRRLVSFTEKAHASGKTPETQVLKFQKNPSSIPHSVLTALQIEKGEPVFYMERLRLADATPVIYERRYVIAKHCPSISKAQIKGSLYKLWTEERGLKISGAEEVIRAVNLKSDEASILQLPQRTACLQVESTGYIGQNQPLWWEDTLYRSDTYEFKNRLGGVHSTKPAVGRLTRR